MSTFQDIYDEKSWINCYHFYQKYRDYFDIASTTNTKRTLFVDLFFWKKVSFYYH